MSKYTPGPWIDNYFDDTQICINSGYELVAVVYSYDEKKEEGNANARLIAASPDLLKALGELVHLHLCELEGLVAGSPTPDEWITAVDKAEVAINKAEGRP